MNHTGKIYTSAMDAVADIPDGAVIMLGGFGTPGSAQNLVKALMDHRAMELTCITNTCLNKFHITNVSITHVL